METADTATAAAVGARIRWYREKHRPKMSQAGLARLAGISQDDRISLFELGKALPTITELRAIGDAMGVPLRLLLLEPEDSTDPLARMTDLCDLEEEAHRLAEVATPEIWAAFTKDVRVVLERMRALRHHANEHQARRKK